MGWNGLFIKFLRVLLKITRGSNFEEEVKEVVMGKRSFGWGEVSLRSINSICLFFI